MVTAVLDGNHYLTLGTTEDDGSPRVSPVFYSHDDYVELYWVSSPHAAHSRNLAARPAVTGVVFDSTAPPGGASAVYLTGTAAQVPDAELPQTCARAFRAVTSTSIAFGPDELSGDAPLRLYRMRAALIEIHVRGSDPDRGTGTDSRLRVDLPGVSDGAVPTTRRTIARRFGRPARLPGRVRRRGRVRRQPRRTERGAGAGSALPAGGRAQSRDRAGMTTYPGLPGPTIEAHLTREASRAIYAAGTEFAIDRISMVGNTGTYLDTPVPPLPRRSRPDRPAAGTSRRPPGRRRTDGRWCRRGRRRRRARPVRRRRHGRAAAHRRRRHFGRPGYVEDAPFLTAVAPSGWSSTVPPWSESTR